LDKIKVQKQRLIKIRVLKTIHSTDQQELSKQGKAQRLDFVPLEQCFKRRHSRRKTNVFPLEPG